MSENHERGNLNESVLRVLVDLRDRTIQKNRIAFGSRVGAVERGDDTMIGPQLELLKRWADHFLHLEQELDKDIAELVADEEVFHHVVRVKGIGPMFSAKLLSMIDIRRCDTVSVLWRYCGYAVFNGERERPQKGQRLRYNKRLKSTCYLIGGSFLKANSPYRQLYDSARDYYRAQRVGPEWEALSGKESWTEGHIHNAALRKMIKIFLSHLWQRWRELENMSTRSPYSELLGHTHFSQPEDYGWPPYPKRRDDTAYYDEDEVEDDYEGADYEEADYEEDEDDDFGDLVLA